MSRSRASWGSMRPEIYRLLRESENENPYWDATLLLQLLNEERDRLDAHFAELFEGYNVLSVTTNIVADQAHYMLPQDCNRLLRVCRLFTDSGYEIPLERLELWSEPTIVPGGSNVGSSNFLPTYRTEDQWIVLSPVPGEAVTNGLKLYYERALTKVDDDDDQVILPAWPYIAELYLKTAVAVAAFEIEGTMGAEQPGYYTSLVKKRDELMAKIEEYAETRSFGRNFGTPYTQGD